MKRPAFQFYPDNWRNNSNLRRCSWAARGVWVEVMCLLHDSDVYGALSWSMKEIAQALGCPIALLRELAAKGVMKGCDSGECEPYIYTPRSGRRDGAPVTLITAQGGPIWYSSRMVRDEYIRTIRGESSRVTTDRDDAHQERRKPSPKGGLGEGIDPEEKAVKSDGSSTSSPSSYSDTSLRSVSAAAHAAPELDGGPIDPRRQLWAEGRGILARLIGAPPDRAGKLLGKWLRDLGDDCAGLLHALRDAEAARPVDPLAWIAAAIDVRASRLPASVGAARPGVPRSGFDLLRAEGIIPP